MSGQSTAKPVPVGFYDFAATHSSRDTARHFSMCSRRARHLIEKASPEWKAERRALMKAASLRIWNPPACFAEFAVGAPYLEMTKRYRVSTHTIVVALRKLPPEVQAAREVELHKRRSKAAIERRRVAKAQRRMDDAGDVETPPGDPMLARYAAVAARRGWIVREYRA